MVGLPAANNDVLVPQLRNLTNKIYTPVFRSFPHLQKIIDTLSGNLQAESSRSSDPSTLAVFGKLKDDIDWLKESLDQDFSKLNKIESHLKFINADETLTNQREIIGIFIEFYEFFDEMILGNLIEVFDGIHESYLNTSADKIIEETLKVGTIDIKQLSVTLRRFRVSLKLIGSLFQSVEKEKIDVVLNTGGINQQEFNNLETSVEKRLIDLTKSISDLESAAKLSAV